MRRVLIVGAGNMGRKWLRTVRDHPDVEVVGLIDLDLDLAQRTIKEEGLAGIALAKTVEELADRADLLIDATVPAAHRAVTMAALRHGLAVLGEKPAAPTLAEAIALAALAEHEGGVFVVSQSRRFTPQLQSLRDWAEEEGATVGALSARFSRGPRFGGFREEMESPLVVDMAIHLFDIARAITGRHPQAVYARETNPSWSWFRGAAGARAIIEFGDGVDFVFDGTWAGRGHDTSWNGDWRVETDVGTVVWDGDSDAIVQELEEDSPRPIVTRSDEESTLRRSLTAFLDSLDAGRIADNEIHDNIRGLAMVEAVLVSARQGHRVEIDTLMEDARAEARALVDDWGLAELAKTLDGWDSVRVALDARIPGQPRPSVSGVF